MRKKILAFILTFTAILMCLFGLTSCNESNNGEGISNIPITSISLNKTTATLTVDETLKLTATITPSDATDKSVTWSSSNISVATVSNGTVTAKSSGTTTITARTNNGKTANCSVTVNDKEILPTSIYLNKTSIELEEGATQTLTTTILPSNATDKNVEWLALDESIATVENGTITAVSEGETTVIATTSNGLTATCNINITSPFVFAEYDTGYTLVSYKGSHTEVIVPSTYKGKDAVMIGAGQSQNYNFIPDAFSNNTNIRKVTLPDTITGINHASFVNCSSLTEINLNVAKVIGAYAFYNCIALNNIQFSNGLTRIYPNAFENCKQLNNIIIPANVQEIGNNAFKGCSALKNVKFENKSLSLGSNSFDWNNFDINIDTPSTPLVFNNWSTGISFVTETATINDITVKIISANSNAVAINIFISGTKTYDSLGGSHKIKFNFKVKNDNYVLASGTIDSASIAEGEVFTASYYRSITIDLSIFELLSDNNLSITLTEVAW